MQYVVQESGYSKNLNISVGKTAEAILSDLDSANNYSIEVAAVNSAGTGVYSAAIYAITKGNIFKQDLNYLRLILILYINVIVEINSCTNGFRPCIEAQLHFSLMI